MTSNGLDASLLSASIDDFSTQPPFASLPFVFLFAVDSDNGIKTEGPAERDSISAEIVYCTAQVGMQEYPVDKGNYRPAIRNLAM